jgi:hypothetical protein
LTSDRCNNEDRLNELASWLISLRQEAKLSIAALSDKTKIMAKHLEALERGDMAALPSLVHARAFALAHAKACGADDEEAIAAMNRAFHPGPAPAAAAERLEETVPAPQLALGVPGMEAPDSPGRGGWREWPWRPWAYVAGGAVVFLLLLNGAVSCLRSMKPVAPAASANGAASDSVVPAPAAAAAGAGATTGTAAPVVAGEALDLRSRRPCWVVLEIDGKRLPTIFLEPDKRERWTVGSRAVMLAGNIGAVRVWWQGDNLGYFGELGERMNGIVFEPGKAWRKDPSADLALPPGVPSKAPN